MSPQTKICPGCNSPFEARPNAKVCSSRCRKRLHRAKQSLQREVQKLAELRQAAIADIQNSLVPPQLASVTAEPPPDFGDDTSPQPSEAGFLETSFAEIETPTAVHPVGHVISPQPSIPAVPVTQPPVMPQPLMAAPEIKSLETQPTAQHWQQLQNSWQAASAQIPSPAKFSSGSLGGQAPPPVVGTESVPELSGATPAPPTPPIDLNSDPGNSNPFNFFSHRPILAGLSFVTLIALISGAFALSGLLGQGKPDTTNLNAQTTDNAALSAASSKLTLNLDTVLAKGKTLTLGQLIAEPTTNILQLTGDFTASGTLSASGGSTFANNSGLVIDKITVCTPAGCIPNVNIPTIAGSSGTAAGTAGAVAILNANQTFTASNKFSANSTSAFSIQNAAGTSNLLIADTISSRIGIGTLTPAYTLDVNGDINSTTGIRLNGALLCNAGGCTAAGGSNSYIQNGTALQSANFNISSATTNSITAIIRAIVAQTADLLQLKDQAGVNILTIGPTGDTLIRPSTDSINGFSVQNAAGTSHLIGGDTLNARVAIAKPTPPDYTLDVGGDINSTTGLRVAGNLVCSLTCTPGGGSGNYVQNGIALQTANFAIQSDLNSHIGGLIRGASGQSADLLDLVNGDSGLNVATFGASGNVLLKNATNSTAAFQIQNAAGTSNLFMVDTTNSQIGIGVAPTPGNLAVLEVNGGARITRLGISHAVDNAYAIYASGTIRGTTLTADSINTNGLGGDTVKLQARGSASQSAANIFEVQTNTPTTVLSVNATGAFLSKNSADSTTAFQVQNAAGTVTLLNIDTSNPTVTIGAGGVNVSIACGTGSSCTFGANGTAHTTTVGSTTSTATTYLQAGTGGLNIGTGGIANTIQVGSITGAVAQTINIGNNATASSTSAVTVGNLLGTSSTTIQGGTGASAIALTQGSGGTVTIGGTAGNSNVEIQCSNSGTCNFGNNSVARNITIGNINGTANVVIQGGSGGVSIGNGGVANTIQVGNTTGAVAQTINIGNNATAASATTIVLGSTIGTSPVTIQAGTSGVLVKPANSTTAFQIQSSTSQNLFTADTNGMNITLNGSNNGESSAWNTNTNTLPAGRSSVASVTANGYVYVIGGFSTWPTVQSSVYYAKLNADGSTGSWVTNTNSLPAARSHLSAVTANGYLYVIGGNNAGAQSTVYFAKLNSDGSTGAWNTSVNPLPVVLSIPTTVATNGYLYVMGGSNDITAQSAVYYAKLNADGSNSAWVTSGNSLPSARREATGVTANGYLYVLGGEGAGGGALSSVLYAQLNSDGSINPWSTGVNSMPSGRYIASSVTMNGYVYVMGGQSGAGAQTTVFYAKFNSDGSTGVWSTSNNSLPSIREFTGAATSNGYIYLLGGDTDGTTGLTTVYYVSTSRIKIGGSIDLVGASGGDLTVNNGAGGSLTAGNTQVVGTLQVRDQASFAQSVSVTGNFNSAGSALFQNSANSTTAFQIQNATGTSLLIADTANLRITLGPASATPVILVLGNKNTSGDPTCDASTAGGIYYNGISTTIRACLNTAWDDLIPAAGWTGAGETWTYASADAPTFTFTVASDVTTKYTPGQRIKLTQTTVKYFLVTAVSTFSGGNTTITVYGGTDYTLANAAISANFYSGLKTPVGFPMDPNKWTVEFNDANNRTQATPTQNTWYNLASALLSIPIGSWNVEYQVNLYNDTAGKEAEAALSTANNSRSDADLNARVIGVTGNVSTSVYRRKAITLASKTTYYLNVRTQNAGVGNILTLGGDGSTIIRAVSAYL